MIAFGLGAALPLYSWRTAITHHVLDTTVSHAPLPHRSVVCAVAEADTKTRTAAEAAAFDEVVMRTYGRYPIVMDHGSGSTLWDVEGVEYLDCVAGIATCTLGHAHKGLQTSVSEQLGKLAHVSNLYYIPEQGQLASWLVANSPADKAFFCNSGGEANEAAIKLVRRYWHTKHPDRSEDTPVIICANNAFHGRTLATITATGQPKYQKGFWPLVPGFSHCDYNDVVSLRKAVEDAGDRFAGIMLEAMQGEGGVNPGAPAFFATARALCDEKDALLVCDEVQVGVGRTGKLWGFENVDVEPDIFTVAKGLAGGIPIGAMACKRFCDLFGPGDHASTFGGNLIASAAGRVVAKELDSGLLENVKRRGAQLGGRLDAIVDRYPGVVQEARGWGLIRGVEISKEAGFDSSRLVQECINRGLLLVPAGTSVVRFVPALVITEQEIDRAADIFESAIEALSGA